MKRLLCCTGEFSFFRFILKLKYNPSTCFRCYIPHSDNLFFIIILCSVGVHTVLELSEMQARMESSGLETYNLTENDLVKDHLRYLVILFPEL